ncbi:MAG: protein translocase subunit SecF [Chitinispirillaceae bacterium]|nr:protein translocase subunit SecF [Chitinispirillaceae bacterium]
MIEIFRNTNYNFIGARKWAVTISIIVIVSSLLMMLIRNGKPNVSIDFAGGTIVQVKFEKPVHDDLGTIRKAIAELGFGTPEVKTVGPVSHNEVQITVKMKSEKSTVGEEIKKVLKTAIPDNPFELRREELVGPKIGSELKTDAFIVIALALVALLTYVGFRFSLPFGFAAIVPLFHDVLVCLAPFFIFNLEISLPTIAALLTIVGYSINDTIVIFDRIRENLRGGGLRQKSFIELANGSINQTLSRTIITSLTLFFGVGFLYFLGGESLKDFSLVMFVGTIVGVYSTMYIACPILIWWNRKWPIKR